MLLPKDADELIDDDVRSSPPAISAEIVAPVYISPKPNDHLNNNNSFVNNNNNINDAASPKSPSPLVKFNGVSSNSTNDSVNDTKRTVRSTPPDLVAIGNEDVVKRSPASLVDRRPVATPPRQSSPLPLVTESSTPDVVPLISSRNSSGIVVDTPPASPSSPLIGRHFQPIATTPPVAQVTPFKIGDDSMVSNGSSQGVESLPNRLADLETVEEELTVTMEKGVFGLGMALEGGKDSPMGDLPIAIKRVFVGGAADRCGDLEVGDVILAANSRQLTGMTRPEAWQFLKTLPQGIVVMNIRRKSYKF